MGLVYSKNGVELYCGDYAGEIVGVSGVDLVLTDPPYGTTDCKWDYEIDLDRMWERLLRVGVEGCSYVFTAAQPFSSRLVLSNIEMFKYEWVWCKSRAVGFFNVRHKPMVNHEVVLVFSGYSCGGGGKRMMVYNPQGVKECYKVVNGIKGCSKDSDGHKFGRPSHLRERIQRQTGYPKTVLDIKSEGRPWHPTQKPIALMEYMIQTYTNLGDLVLDPFVGSGATLIAAKRLGRRGIGIERDEGYCEKIIDCLEGELI